MTRPAGTTSSINTAWEILHLGLAHRRVVRVTYHDRHRLVCPHVLGWKNGRAKVLVYQTAVVGPSDHPRGWRDLFVDQVADAALTDEPWHTPAAYTPVTSGIDVLAAAL